MLRSTLTVLLALLFVVAGIDTALAKRVTFEDVFVADQVRVAAIPLQDASITSGAGCWSTNSLSPSYWDGGWPVVTDFYPNDLLAYCSAPFRVYYPDSGVCTLHVNQYATVRGEYIKLERATLETSLTIDCDPQYQYTDWALAVYMSIPGFLSLMRESHAVDWDMQVSGFQSASGSGQITVYPGKTTSPQASPRGTLRAPAKPLGPIASTWAHIKGND